MTGHNSTENNFTFLHIETVIRCSQKKNTVLETLKEYIYYTYILMIMVGCWLDLP